jgi:precorrin-6A/cobalt-precorrin-6A reductase
MRPLRILLLGGTSEASALARRLAGDDRFEATLSLAGRTRAPALPPIPQRIGGFGGVDGLVAYLVENATDVLIDATHPFAARMSANGVAASALSGVPLLRLTRPPWCSEEGDDWILVPDMASAPTALGERPRNVFLTVGRQELAPFRAAPQHAYLIRSVDAPEPSDLPPSATVITARGPFTMDDEIALLRERRIEIVVSKNSGADATIAKLRAARVLGVKVVMIERPPVAVAPLTDTVGDPADAMAWLEHRHGFQNRGV